MMDIDMYDYIAIEGLRRLCTEHICSATPRFADQVADTVVEMAAELQNVWHEHQQQQPSHVLPARATSHETKQQNSGKRENDVEGGKTSGGAEAAAIWALAAERFAAAPYSNGHDKRYEAVKAEIRGLYGVGAINADNKARLKALAVAQGVAAGTSSTVKAPVKGWLHRSEWDRLLKTLEAARDTQAPVTPISTQVSTGPDMPGEKKNTNKKKKKKKKGDYVGLRENKGKYSQEIMGNWQVLYCGGSRPMVAKLKHIHKKYKLDLKVEAFNW